MKRANASQMNVALPLRQLSQITKLTLGHPTQLDLSFVTGLTNVEELNLYVSVAPKQLSHLTRMPALKHIRIFGIRTTQDEPEENALEIIGRITDLRSLDISAVTLRDDDLVHLGALHKLESLRISRSQILGPGLKHLATLQSLKQIDIPSMAPQYFAKSRAAVPHVAVAKVENKMDLRFPEPNFTPNQRLVNDAKKRIERARDHIKKSEYELGEEWIRHLQVGFAARVMRDWPTAVKAYETAIRCLSEEFAMREANRDQIDKPQLANDLASLIWTLGQIRFEGQRDYRAAADTLRAILSYSPAELAQSDDDLERLASTGGQPYDEGIYRKLKYARGALRLLAFSLEKTDRPSEALRIWSRLRLAQLAYNSRAAHIDPMHLIALRAQCTTKAETSVPVFLNVDESTKSFTVRQLAVSKWYDSMRRPFHPLVAPLGTEIASLELDLPDDMGVECWYGDAEFGSPAAIPLESASIDSQSQHLAVPHATNVLFLRFATQLDSAASVSIRAQLRPGGAGQGFPWAPLSSAPPKHANFEQAPFRFRHCWIASDNQRQGSFRLPADDAPTSLVRMKDNRLLLVYTDWSLTFPRLMVTTSADGVHWQAPWNFPFNDTFAAIRPRTVLDDDGIVWMFYTSRRGSVSSASGGVYTIWRTSTQNGRDWSDPTIIMTPDITITLSGSEIEVVRAPDGDFVVYSDEVFVRTGSLAEITRLDVLFPSAARRRIAITGHRYLAFDAQGGCHCVVPTGYEGEISYTYSPDMIDWSPLHVVARSENRKTEIQPVLVFRDGEAVLAYRSGDHVAMVHGSKTRDDPTIDQDF